jgi:broad specificity phosphatase PhoE
MSDALFRETHCWSNFEVKLSLPALSWIAASRGLWSFGYPVGEETPQQVKHRAEQAAQYLIDIATQEDCVVLVGHGGFNYHIGKVLHTLGWQSSRSRTFGLAHWGCIHFTLLHHIS